MTSLSGTYNSINFFSGYLKVGHILFGFGMEWFSGLHVSILTICSCARMLFAKTVELFYH
jgi:hypothetical protein